VFLASFMIFYVALPFMNGQYLLEFNNRKNLGSL